MIATCNQIPKGSRSAGRIGIYDCDSILGSDLDEAQFRAIRILGHEFRVKSDQRTIGNAVTELPQLIDRTAAGADRVEIGIDATDPGRPILGRDIA